MAGNAPAGSRTHDLSITIDRRPFINYPQTHRKRVVALPCEIPISEYYLISEIYHIISLHKIEI